MKKASLTLFLSAVTALFLCTQASASLYTGTWSSANTPGDEFYVPAGTWSQNILSPGNGPYFIGAYGTMTADDLPSPPYPAVGAPNPVWRMVSYTRTACEGTFGTDLGNNWYSGDFIATYQGHWQFVFRSDADPSIFDTFDVGNMLVTVSYTMTYNNLSGEYALSGMTWNGHGLVDQDSGYTFTMYALGFEDSQVDASGVHSGIITLAQGTISAVPIPGAVWLFATGLLALPVLRRKPGR